MPWTSIQKLSDRYGSFCSYAPGMSFRPYSKTETDTAKAENRKPIAHSRLEAAAALALDVEIALQQPVHQLGQALQVDVRRHAIWLARRLLGARRGGGPVRTRKLKCHSSVTAVISSRRPCG